MKIQGLAVIAVIIILPLSILLGAYSQNQIKTLQLQVQYDSKLTNATYDAIKSFQMNMSNSDTSDLANSKMRDIEASVGTFYNSLASNFNMTGYGEDILKNYVPAVVYTLYDGYYIYSQYDNILDEDDNNKIAKDNAIYKDGDNLSGLKPYIYYSCRYKPDADSDFVITYSLDSYITIQGKIDKKPVNESGYLLTGVKDIGNKIEYRGVEITSENMLEQFVYYDEEYAGLDGNDSENFYDENNKLIGVIGKFPCKKVNGVKYYNNESQVFSVINGKKLVQSNISADNINNGGRQYYKDANTFSKWVLNNEVLRDLTSDDAVDNNGNPYEDNNNPFRKGRKIFGELDITQPNSKYIEDSDSEFNAHKLEVIKNSIESNLMVAISNYNKVSTSDVNFAMPKLNDEEWEQLTKNVSMITFLQGINIGGKVYNGHSIVRNDLTEDFVSEDSIRICYNNKYFKVTDPDILTKKVDLKYIVGVFNVDFEQRMASVGDKTIYYYPRKDMASYESIINPNTGDTSESINEYLKNKDTIAKIYYTALGRERYGMYRVTNKLEEVQNFY